MLNIKKLFNGAKKEEKEPEINFKGVNFSVNATIPKHTPDIVQLEQKEAHLYFAYHMVNNGHPNYLEQGVTVDNFQLWKGRQEDGIPYPVAMPHTAELSRVPCLPIKGRLLLMPTEHLIKLDEYTQNGVQFIRRRVEILVPRYIETEERDAVIRLHERQIFPATFRRKNTTHTKGGRSVIYSPTGGRVNAFMHIGLKKHFVPQLDGGFNFEPVKPFNTLFPKYLQFTVRDFEQYERGD